MKFRGLDRNNDGRITRDEWRGSDHSFSMHDRNRDEVLSGSEVGEAAEAEGYDDFSEIDRNRDGVISRNEWHWEWSEFDRLDGNRNGSLTRQEYMGTAVEDHGSHFPVDRQNIPSVTPKGSTQTLRDRYSRFHQLDRNDNGQISRDEWDGDRASFSEFDDNNNGALSRDEFLKVSPEERLTLFKQFDLNRNGVISQKEWHGDKQSFARLDTNADGRLMREEFIKRYGGLDEHFRELDRDRNGRLSSEEWQGEKRAFDRLDDNRDGQITFEEFVGTSLNVS